MVQFPDSQPETFLAKYREALQFLAKPVDKVPDKGEPPAGK